MSIRNIAPTADASSDQVVEAGTLVVLDGSGSQDPNEDVLSCSWSRTEGPPVALAEDGAACTAWFVAQSSGVHVFELVMSDSQLLSLPNHVQVVVNAVNQVPTANAGQDQLVLVSDTVTLDGRGSTDPDGDIPAVHLAPGRRPNNSRPRKGSLRGNDLHAFRDGDVQFQARCV